MNFIYTNGKMVFVRSMIETIDISGEGGDGINQEPIIGELQNVFDKGTRSIWQSSID